MMPAITATAVPAESEPCGFEGTCLPSGPGSGFEGSGFETYGPSPGSTGGRGAVEV
jgi:hypothetical protein